jgi:hypothetical protein
MRRAGMRGLVAMALVAVVGLVLLQPHPSAAAGSATFDSQGLSLITETPEEGFALAISLARKGVTETQQDREVLHALRPGYSHDADALIAVSHVIAVHFQTIAAANAYWR